jgi:serine/threonine protein kinase
MLYEMVTGLWPFEALLSGMLARVVSIYGRAPDAEQVREMMRAITEEKITDEPPSPREFAPDIDPELKRVILRAIARAPGHPYKSGANMYEDIKAVWLGLSGEGDPVRC